MATTARLDLSVWRNDDLYEFPIRVRGPDLTGIALRAQFRLQPDSPGSPLIDLTTVTNGNAEGLRLAGVSQVGGVAVNDVRLRLNRATRQALPYAGEMGDPLTLAWAMQIGGRTRIVGKAVVLAHAIDSDAAPTSRPGTFSSGALPPMPEQGATLTIANDDVAQIAIDGADMLGAFGAMARDAATRAEAAAATVDAAVAPIRDTVSRKPGKPAASWKDALGRIAMYLSGDGRRLRMIGGAVLSPRNPLRSSWGIVDLAGRIAARLSSDGRVFQTMGWALERRADGASVLRSADGAPVLVVEDGKPPVLQGHTREQPVYADVTGRMGGAAMRPARADPLKIAGWGSSTMELLSADMAAMATAVGATYHDGGRSSEWSFHAAARSGARHALATVIGGSIPTSGSAVVTISNIPGGTANALFKPTPGTLAGVSGTLDYSGGGYRFTRSASGAAVVVAPDTPFLPDAGTTQRDAVTILNVGKNDLNDMGDVAGVIERTARMVDHLTPLMKRAIVMTHFVDRDTPVGSPMHDRIAAVNAAYAERYGALLVDLRGWLRGQTMYGQTVWTNVGITPTDADNVAMAEGRKPPSLSRDSGHMNDAANASVRWLIERKLLDLGWYPEGTFA